MNQKSFLIVETPKGTLSTFMFALTRNVFVIKSVSFIGGLFFLVISFLIFWVFLELVTDYRERINRPWVTLPGNEIKSTEELARAAKHHGVLLQERNDVTGEWGFYRDGQWCKSFKPEKKK